MQRQPYPPAQANSPPLHHPVPQHVSTVPMMRSPPPPASSAGGSGYGGSPYPGDAHHHHQHQQPGAAAFAPAFGGFMNDQTAQMGLQLGKSAAMAGQEYMQQNWRGFISFAKLKPYFNVTTIYVLHKLVLVLFPWRHRPWSRQQQPSPRGNQDQGNFVNVFLPPREDINSPDMYIPSMAFVTYILLSALLAGIRGVFHPEVMGSTSFYAAGIVVLEMMILWFGTYMLSISNESYLDLIAYSGYKFVGVIVTLVTSEIVNLGKGTGGWVGWTVFIYTFLANAFFLLRSLKYVLLPDSSGPNAGLSHTVARSQRTKRTQFLFFYAYLVQFLFMWILSRQDSSTGRAGKV